jgi:hypothetical protein
VRRLLIATALAAVAVVPQPAAAAPVSSHMEMPLCGTPAKYAWSLLGEARASRAEVVRVSVGMPCWFEDGWGNPTPHQPWSHLEEMLALARMRGVRVLGVLQHTPKLVSRCQDRYQTGPYACPPADLARWAEMAGEIAHRARGTITHWEILNEPDQPAYFSGTPEDYARMLRAAHDAIKARVPEARIVLSGLSRPRPSWMERVFATPGADAAHAFDVAGIHLRGRAHLVPRHLAAWKRFLGRHGFDGPLWVTEHGYPGETAFQYDARFRGGEDAQAAYLTESVLRLARAGAERVFVTLTDMYGNPRSAFSSEGITELVFSIYREEPVIARRPALYAMRRLSRRWRQLTALVSRHRAALRNDPSLARRLARRIAGPFRGAFAP